jgi:hypothetical protein
LELKMRVVIYDREDMEPITVITLPEWGREFLREIERGHRGPEITFPVRPPMRAVDWKEPPADVPVTDFRRFQCRIRFEPIWEGDGPKRRCLMWLCTTRDGESALLLKSTFLPGQQAAVNEERQKAFTDGLMAAFSGRV